MYKLQALLQAIPYGRKQVLRLLSLLFFLFPPSHLTCYQNKLYGTRARRNLTVSFPRRKIGYLGLFRIMKPRENFALRFLIGNGGNFSVT